MRLIALVAAAALVAGCDGGSGSGGGGGSRNAELADLRVASNGCIMSSNEDASFTYQAGGSTAKHLMWACAEYDYHQSSFVEKLAHYSTADACYKLLATHVQDNWCRRSVAAPSEAVPRAEIVDVGPVPYQEFEHEGVSHIIEYRGQNTAGENVYRLVYNPRVENTGHVRIFGLYMDVYLEGEHIARHHLPANRSLNPVDDPALAGRWSPAGSPTPDTLFTMRGIAGGGVYEVRMALMDRHMAVLDEKTALAETRW